MEKRGPVEFNHAISYVNKIKVSKAISSTVQYDEESILSPPTSMSFVTSVILLLLCYSGVFKFERAPS